MHEPVGPLPEPRDHQRVLVGRVDGQRKALLGNKLGLAAPRAPHPTLELGLYADSVDRIGGEASEAIRRLWGTEELCELQRHAALVNGNAVGRHARHPELIKSSLCCRTARRDRRVGRLRPLPAAPCERCLVLANADRHHLHRQHRLDDKVSAWSPKRPIGQRPTIRRHRLLADSDAVPSAGHERDELKCRLGGLEDASSRRGVYILITVGEGRLAGEGGDADLVIVRVVCFGEG